MMNEYFIESGTNIKTSIKTSSPMKTLNKFGKLFFVMFVFSLSMLVVFWLFECGWRKLVAWFPYQSGVELLDRLQAHHPVLFMVVICSVTAFIGAVVAFIGSVRSMRDLK